MKQIKRIISSMSDWVSLTLMVDKRFAKPDAKPLVVILRPLDKSHEQLGYLHSTVLPIFTQTMFDAGELQKNSEGEAKYYLKVLINYGEWVGFRKSVVFVPNSFEKATTEDLGRAIDEAIKQCEIRGVCVPPPKGGN